ncbi:ribonuclease HI [Candidatus Westeberhardia cardiocondylae]|uniref:ribonuclease HI n=1 Tax=Candidatus Westeberhardia cardiocondylae TaxID=1594731 RepID=UPI002481AC1B|nr:ribonuclease HI [Candidatus Westeberhardia cardiocondylae]
MYKKIQIFTDGSCLGNPGQGGYASIITYKKNYEKIFSAGYITTTNNRMELIAVIIPLKKIKYPCEISLYTDSQYIKLGITKWIKTWKKYNWKNSKKKLIKNIDLWKQLDLTIQNKNIHWNWIKSHSGYKENEHCDKLARLAAHNPIFKDINYKLI